MDISARKYDGNGWDLDDPLKTYFYRQPGGCLEIGQVDDDDLIHVEAHDVDRFMELLNQFVKESHAR